ncbi:MAG: isoprenylcysteine carboxylmethyltransferase family protein [Paracoccus sp. (in: a-proteobacteria)]|nr:isoprenylcysteine carboxylmethyltransferase family protein [Paracoccus sp. (in: a-proteobacteria)]
MRKAVNQGQRINILRLVMLIALPVILLVPPGFGSTGAAHELIETAGMLLLFTGVLGRLWSILYVGGIKNAELMTDGPFSMTRNPLYFFSTLAATGIGLMLGAFSFALLLGGVIGLVLWITAKRESAFLRQEFGPAYDAYAARVPFFFPDPRLFSAKASLTVRIAPLRRNLADALVFLAFIPFVELVDVLKTQLGWTGFQLW